MVFLSNISANAIHKFGKNINHSFMDMLFHHLTVSAYILDDWSQRYHVPSGHKTTNNLAHAK